MTTAEALRAQRSIATEGTEFILFSNLQIEVFPTIFRGAFVDIGVKEDGLLHISQMSKGRERVTDPHDVIAVGDIITVEITSIDTERGRIGLSLG